MADLESIYRQYSDTVFRFLMSKTGSVELAEELTQETFYQAVKSIDRYDGSSRITSWLCGIAQNVLYAHLRARQKDPLPLEDVPEQPVVSTEDLVVTRDETRAILEAIRELPDPGGEIMRMRIFDWRVIMPSSKAMVASLTSRKQRPSPGSPSLSRVR